MITGQYSSKTSPVGFSWFGDKKVSVSWKVYEQVRRGEVFRVLDLRRYFEAIDRPVQGRVFKQSSLVLLLVLKIFTSLFYRAFTSFSEAFRLHEVLGEERPPSYKTINNATDLVSEEFLLAVNRLITPKHCRLAGRDMDSKGLKRRQGEHLSSRIKDRRKKEAWLRIILWNTTIYPTTKKTRRRKTDEKIFPKAHCISIPLPY